MRVLVVSKITGLEHYKRGSGLSGKELERHLEDKGIDVTELAGAASRHDKSLAKVRLILEKKGFAYDFVLTDELPVDIETYALVVCVGGDGTVLSSSHHVEDKTPIIGVNSDTKRSRGMLACCSASDFENVLVEVLEGKRKPVACTRLHLQIPGVTEEIPFVLNDIFIGGEKPFDTVKYTISVDSGRRVRHMDSGLLVSTGVGSTAWIFNASRVNEDDVREILKIAGCDSSRAPEIVSTINSSHSFPRNSMRMRYFSRDIVENKVTSSDLQSGFAKRIELASMMYKGTITVDNRCSYDFSYGKKAIITVSSKPLMLVE